MTEAEPHNVLMLDDFRRQPEGWEQSYKQAMTVQQLIDKLAFMDRKARVYVRYEWIAGVVAAQERADGVYGQPTVLLYVNLEELPK